jgi:hypothetical protein
MPILPTELVHLVFEPIWDSLCKHAGEDYLVRPQFSSFAAVFGNLRLVRRSWAAHVDQKFSVRVRSVRCDLKDPMYLYYLAKGSKGDLRACRLHEMRVQREDTEDAALARWQADLEGRTHLEEFVLRLQNDDDMDDIGFILVSDLAEEQLQTMTRVGGLARGATKQGVEAASSARGRPPRPEGSHRVHSMGNIGVTGGCPAGGAGVEHLGDSPF